MLKLIKALGGIIKILERLKGWLLLGAVGALIALTAAKIGKTKDDWQSKVFADTLKRLNEARDSYRERLKALDKPQEPSAVVDEFNKRFGG